MFKTMYAPKVNINESTHIVLKLRVKQVTYVMTQIYNDNTERPKPKENQPGILGISSRKFTHYVGNSAEGLGFRRERCWGYISIFENFCLIYWCV